MLQDIRYVARSFARTPGFFIATTLTLALGIAATTAIFSVVNGVLLQPLPYPRSDRIVQLFPLDKLGKRTSSSEPNFADWQAQARGFSTMAMVSPVWTITVNGLSEPVRARATSVTRGFFPVFGLVPEAGRTFNDAEQRLGGAPAAVVSHDFAQKYLGGNRAAIGRTITIGPRLFTIVGVMPPEMNYPAGSEIWLPQEIDEPNPSRTSGGKRVVARLRDGVTFGASDARSQVVDATSQTGIRRRDVDVGRRRGHVARAARGQRTSDAARAAWRVGVPVAHRLRERREPAARADGGAPT